MVQQKEGSMKKLVLGGLLMMLAARSFAGVFISEYIEGTGSNKALEIYNGTGASINMMNDYRLGVAFNGVATATMYQFNKNVAPGDVFVVANSFANVAIVALADTLSNGFANWNGDDFIGLYQMVAGSPVLVDVFGVLGTDPGTSWTVAGDAAGTVNHTLIRKPTYLAGNTNWALSAGTNPTDAEWTIGAVDTWADLGMHTVDTGVPVIGGMTHTPENPHSTETVTVTANVSDNGTLTAVSLLYTVDGGAVQTVAMTLGVAPSYSGVIPAQADLAVVAYHIEATDDAANTTVSGSGTYTVHDSFPCADMATIRANDANGSPLLLNQVRSVCGVVTATNQFGAAGPVYITGSTGSVALYGAGYLTGVTIGDEIQATGTVGFYNGLTEFINPTFLNIVAHPGEPTPVPVTLAQLIAGGESYEAQFVSLTGLTLDPAAVWPVINTNGSVTVWQGTDSFTMYVDRDTDIDGTPAPTGTFDLKAIVGQFDAATPFFEGYQLLPRFTTDLTFVGNQPPAVAGVSHSPYVPSSSESVTITATVTDDAAVAGVSMVYQVNGGGWAPMPMNLVSGDVYDAILPAYPNLSVVEYYVEATDDMGETNASPTNTYTVYDVFPCGDIAAMRVLDTAGVPVMVNQRVFVCGTVTATNQFDATRGPIYITGSTGSMALYGTAALPAGLVIGDEVEAIGTIKNYNGLIELDPTEYASITGHPGALAPVELTLAQLIAAPEAYEAQLVKVSGLTLDPAAVWPASGFNATLTVWQGTDSFALQIDKDTDLDEGTAPVGAFDLVALVGQYDTATPFDAGYQLLPRFQTDITVVPTALDTPVLSIVYANPNVIVSWAPVTNATNYTVFTSTTSSYSGWDAGVAVGNVTTITMPTSGKAFYKVVANN